MVADPKLGSAAAEAFVLNDTSYLFDPTTGDPVGIDFTGTTVQTAQAGGGERQPRDHRLGGVGQAFRRDRV